MLVIILTFLSVTFNEVKIEFQSQNGCDNLNSTMDTSSICNKQCHKMRSGDVYVELPGKIGFLRAAEALSGMSESTIAANYGLGIDGMLPISQLVTIMNESLPYTQGSTRLELEDLIGSFTTEKAGTVACNVFETDSGIYVKKWRPYNRTMGWHYSTYNLCTDRGWSGFGTDPSVQITIQFDGNIGYVAQNSKNISLSSRITYAGNLNNDDALRFCCYPATEEERNCSAVELIVNNFNESSL